MREPFSLKPSARPSRLALETSRPTGRGLASFLIISVVILTPSFVYDIPHDLCNEIRAYLLKKKMVRCHSPGYCPNCNGTGVGTLSPSHGTSLPVHSEQE